MRKLANAALAFSLAIFAANYILPAAWLLVSAVLAAVAAAVLALLHRKWLRPAVIALLFFSLGLLDYSLYDQRTTQRARDYDGQTREIVATVIDYPDVYDGYCRLRLRLQTEGMPAFHVIAYDNAKQTADAVPGEKLRFTARITTADTLYGKPYDNYHVNGYFLRLTIRGESEDLGHSFDLRSIPIMLRHRLCAMADACFPADTRVFMKALMLGDKDEFYADDALYVSMTRAGLMHVVAVSGLHIAFLVGLLQLLFGKGRRSALLSVGLVWLFVLVTGSGKAAVRAGFMQTLLLLAPVLRRENDPITSLSSVLALVLAVSPYAARSVSLQLSFSAMAGIIFFSEPIYRKLLDRFPWLTRWRSTRYITGTLVSSLSVMGLTVPLTALHFGYIPLLSILSNLACLWAVSACFCCGWIACALSIVPLIGKPFVLLCTALVRYIFFCAHAVSSIPYAVLYTQTPGARLWMWLSYAALFAAWLLRRRSIWLRVIVPSLLSLSVLILIFWRSDRSYRTRDMITILNVGQGQCITAMVGEATAVIDCGNTGTLDHAGALAGEYLLSRGRDHVDILMLTHLHADHVDGVTRLMELLPVDTLLLPADADDSDGLLADILSAAERHGTRVAAVDHSIDVVSGRIELELYHLPGGETENERCLMAKLSIGDAAMLVTADAPQEMEQMLVQREDLSDVEILVVGHHGSKYASSAELLSTLRGGIAVISSGYNTYGHPAEETLERLAENGYTVYRTDQDGTIEIQLGANNG